MLTPEPLESPAPDTEAGGNYLIRSEERLDVRIERVPSGWVRLEKYLVTETRTVTVDLTHEEVRLVHEPVDRAGQTPRRSSAGLNAARWMYVNREELVITKKVVPVERVRLEVFPVIEERQITETVRKEQITDEPTVLSQDRPDPDSTPLTRDRTQNERIR